MIFRRANWGPEGCKWLTQSPEAVKSQGWGLKSLGHFHCTGLNVTRTPAYAINKDVSLVSFWSFLGTQGLTTLLLEVIFIFYFPLEFSALKLIQSIQGLTCLPFSRQLQSWSCGPWCRNLAFPDSKALHHPPSPLVLTISACARCFRKQIPCTEFPDHNSQTAEGWGPFFFFFHQLYFLWRDIFLEPVKKDREKKNPLPNKQLWSNTENAGVLTFSRMDRMSTVATTELVWIESECNVAERMPACRVERGLKGLG